MSQILYNKAGDNTESIKNIYKEFRESIIPTENVLILTHDYPDPDAIASAYGVSALCSFWGVKNSVISFGGFVGRAENRAMIRFLNIDMIPWALIDLKEFQKVVLVDSFPGKGNISLPNSIKIDAVIDHHPLQFIKNDLTFFYDIRMNVGSTSTIIAEYIEESGCPISSRLATALFYGIKTDTYNLMRDVSEKDFYYYNFLFSKIDHRMLSLIENPERDTEFFRILHRATRSALIFDKVGYIYLGKVPSPDYIAEMADLFSSLEKVDWIICNAIFKNQLFFSIRSKKSNTAGAIAEQIGLRMGGSGGGHSFAAAGRIGLNKNEEINILMAKFESLYKELFNISSVTPQKLLSL
ncbi:MAG: DHH family phosphoesterase [Chitinispirillaceae bacterium]|nr:DHH family phosphoesterase [Chitinispirillaceae bacterium]